MSRSENQEHVLTDWRGQAGGNSWPSGISILRRTISRYLHIERASLQRRFLIAMVVIGAQLGLLPSAIGQTRKEQPLQEVFQSNVVYTQEKGELQLTTGFSLHKIDGAVLVQLPLTLEYGITDKWQVELQWDGVNSMHPTIGSSLLGPGDLSIGTQYSFMNISNTDLHLAVGFELGIPTGDGGKSMSEGLFEYEPFAIVAKDFPGMSNLQVFTQVGVKLVKPTGHRRDLENEGPAAHEFTLSSGFFVPLRPVCITTEFTWVTNEWNHGGKENRRSLTPGLVWRLPHSWEIGVGAEIGLTCKSTDPRVILKLTREF